MRRLITTATLVWVGTNGLGGSDAWAQAFPCGNISDLPCALQIADLQVQKAPASFRFQARVSQAKLPTGTGVFPELTVQILRESEVLCTERFRDVAVGAGVVNLEVGQAMACRLDDVIAENPGHLALRLCVGDGCLDAVELPSSFYALKATYAEHAQAASRTDRAARASYAHRGTADDTFFGRRRPGAGYIDFVSDRAGTDAGAGMITWVPTRRSAARRLHIAGGLVGTRKIGWLDTLVLGAASTRLTGNLSVKGGADVKGELTATGDTSAGSVHTLGPATTADLTVDGNATVPSLTVTGAVTLGDGSSPGDTRVTTDATFKDALVVQGDTTVGSATFLSTVTLNDGTLSVGAVSTKVLALLGDATVAAQLTATGGGTISGATTVGPAGGWPLSDASGARTLAFGSPAVDIATFDGAGHLTGGTLLAALAPAHPGGRPLYTHDIDGIRIITTEWTMDVTDAADYSGGSVLFNSHGFWIAEGSTPCTFAAGEQVLDGSTNVNFGSSSQLYPGHANRGLHIFGDDVNQVRAEVHVAGGNDHQENVTARMTALDSFYAGGDHEIRRLKHIDWHLWRHDATHALPEESCRVHWRLSYDW